MSIVHYVTKKFIAANVLKIAIPQKEQSMKVICQKSIRKKQIGETSARIANGIIIKHQLQPVLFSYLTNARNLADNAGFCYEEVKTGGKNG